MWLCLSILNMSSLCEWITNNMQEFIVSHQATVDRYQKFKKEVEASAPTYMSKKQCLAALKEMSDESEQKEHIVALEALLEKEYEAMHTNMRVMDNIKVALDGHVRAMHSLLDVLLKTYLKTNTVLNSNVLDGVEQDNDETVVNVGNALYKKLNPQLRSEPPLHSSLPSPVCIINVPESTTGVANNVEAFNEHAQDGHRSV